MGSFKNWKSYSSNVFQKMPFQRQLLLSLLTPVLLIFGIAGLGSYISSSSTIRSEVLSYADISVNQMSKSLDNYLVEMNRLLSMPFSDEKLQTVLKDISLPKDSFEEISEIRYIQNFLSNIYLFRPDIHSVFLIANNGSTYAEGFNRFMENTNVMEGEAWYSKLSESRGNTFIIGPRQSTPYATTTSPYKVFTLGRKIFNANGIYLGTLIIDIRYEYFASLFVDINTWQNVGIAILNDENRVFYLSTYSGDNEGMEVRVFQGLTMSYESLRHDAISGGQKNLIVSSTSPGTGLEVFMMIPESSLFSRINTMSRFMVLIFIASIILSLLFSSMISSAVLRPIKKLTQLMSRVEKGDFSVSVKVAGDNEIGALGHGFNTMISEINGLINKTIEFEVRNKESEYKALQSQINPHFLYNTLESIRMRCIVKKELELAEIINTLGSLFRLSIDRGERFAPLNDELEHVKSYMKIQNFRYEDKFSLNLHVPGDLLDCMVFKLMLQPLVENCIFHGLEMKPEDGRIDVRVKLVEEDLRIEIEDNGLGINEDTLRKLNDMLENREDYKTKQSIGLRNVHDRIRLFFGDPYGLQIESKEGSGTLITICMPAFKNERDIR